MPLLVLAVMVASPVSIPFTLPLLSTIAIALSLLLQVTVLSAAFLGKTVAASVPDFPLINARLVGFKTIEGESKKGKGSYDEIVHAEFYPETESILQTLEEFTGLSGE